MLATKVYVLTDNFKLMFKLSQLELQNIVFRHVLSLDNIPNNSLVLSDRPINENIEKYSILNKNMSIVDLKKRILRVAYQDQTDKIIYVGIDPGKNIGLAIVHLKSVLKTDTVLSIDRLVLWLRRELLQWHYEKIIIRIGDGVIHFTTKIIERLRFEFEYDIELVDEKSTSFKEINTKTIHEQAAIRIACRKGIKQ